MEPLHAPWRIQYILGPKEPTGDGSIFTRIARSSDDETNLVIARAKSRSTIVDVPLKEAYGEDFEDIRRRRPDLTRLRRLTGFRHRFTLEQTIDDLVEIERRRMAEEQDGNRTLVRPQSERAA